MPRILVLCWFVIVALIHGPGCSSAQQSVKEACLLLENVNVVDVIGEEIRLRQDVIITDGVIRHITGHNPEERVPCANRVVGSGKYVIPGLWDMHVHALWNSEVADAFLPLFVKFGITTIRDMGGTVDVLKEMRNRYEKDEMVAPRIFAAGSILDGPEPIDPSISIAVTDSSDAVLAVNALSAAGVDFIKVYTTLPRVAFYSSVARANQLGLPVAGHVPAEIPVIEAAEAGMRSIEHLRDEIEPFCDASIESDCVPFIDVFRRHNTYMTPTLTILYNKSHIDQTNWLETHVIDHLPDIVTDTWNQMRSSRLSGDTSVYFESKRNRFQKELLLTKALSEADIPILAGTDAGDLFVYPGYSLHTELMLLTEAGLSNFEALRSATIWPAEFMGVADETGSIGPGKAADLVVLDLNPVDDIRNIASIRGVILRGKWMDSQTLSNIADRNR